MKTFLVATLCTLVGVIGTVSYANRTLDGATLEHLQRLDGTDCSHTIAALTTFNEHALDHLPVAATLRAEDALAGAVLALCGTALKA